MDKQTTIIEVNGIKLEVDLRSAKRIDELKIGSRVKCLVKKYDDHYNTCPGVVVGFEPFPSRPTIVVAYLESDWNAAGLVFKSFNAGTKDFEIVADLDHNALEIDKGSVLDKFDRQIQVKDSEAQELRDKRAFFLARFDAYFAEVPAAAKV